MTFWMQSVLVFLAVFVTDIMWVWYIAAVADRRRLWGATIAATMLAVGGFITISYVGDFRLLLSACAGGFLGTWLGITRNRPQ